MARARGAHGNPSDVQRLIRRQLAKTRAAWQRPDRVVRTLRVRRGAVVADVGAGPGYFTERLARAVGPRGRVYAVDPEPLVLGILLKRLRRAANVTPVLSRDDDPMLPPASCDLAVIVNAYHHFADGAAFVRRVARCLKRGGRLVNIDWAYRETAKGPPMHRHVPPETVIAAARRAGLRLTARHDFLPYQDFLIFAR
jgi:ubiquinone/menaquinone biosynthesis C-methylase UbiE